MKNIPLQSKPWQLWSLASIYGPLIPWFVWQMVWNNLRHRIGLTGVLRVNPPFKDWDSWEFRKASVYERFRDCEYAIPTILIRAHDKKDPQSISQYLQEGGLTMPVVAKANLGTMSTGIRKFETLEELVPFLQHRQIDYVIQSYINLPLEFAIFYYKFPDTPSGKILDLTERVLPQVTGDGQHTMAELIESSTDWALITEAVKQNYNGDLNRIPRDGETVLLNVAASGGRGAFFADSRHLITPQLEKRIDAIASNVDFYWGKFDFKVASLDDLAKGENLKLLEANPLGAEINYIYDRKYSYRQAMKEIKQQYKLALAIAIKNRPFTPPPPSLREVARKAYQLSKSCRLINKLESLEQ